jgi:putative transposase
MSSPTYVLTLPLKVQTWQEHILEKRLNIGRNIYNACLGEAWRRYKHMIRNPRYWEAVRMQKGKERNQLLNQWKEQYGVRKYALNMYVQGMGRKFKQNIGFQMAQNIAERAFQENQCLTQEKDIFLYLSFFGVRHFFSKNNL